MEDLEHWKDLAHRRRRTVSSLSDRVDELEGYLSDANDLVDDYQSELSALRGALREKDARFNDKTELLKQIGRLS